MDYNELNNFLQNLQIKDQSDTKIYEKKINNEFNTFNNNNGIFSDNKIKDVVLERDLRLNNNINFSREIANPQRFNETRLKKNTNELNNKLNNYNFNNYSTKYRNNNDTNLSDNFNINTKNIVKNDINDKLSQRDKLPNNSVFSFDMQ